MTKKRRVLVTGTMRSGTTFVGDILARSQNLFYLQEPFNPTWGIRGVTQWFPYIRDEDSPYARLVDQFFDLNFSYRSPADTSTIRGRIKRIVGGKNAWLGSFYRYVGHYFSGMLIKDPLSALLSRYMHENHRVAVVVLVRHPVAFYYSNKRLGWDFDLNNLRKQTSLLEDHLQEEALLLEKDWTYPERLALLWRCINKVLHEFGANCDGEEMWLVKCHEDICINPIKEFNDIFYNLEINMSEHVINYVESSTSSGNTISAQGNDTHQLHRNSEKLAYYWKQRVSVEERDQIRSMTESVAARFYEDESWNL